MPKTTPEQNKALVLEAFDTLFNKRDYEAQNKPRPNSGCPQNTPGRTATSLSSKKQSLEPFPNPIGEELPTTRPGDEPILAS
jgi:hypothetical protein